MDKSQRKTIGIDSRFYGPVGKGLGRYVKEVVDRVVKNDKDNDYVVFLSPENFDSFNISAGNIRKVKVDIKWYGFKEQLILPWVYLKAGLDLLHVPHFNVPIFVMTPFVVTIHDLILTKFPTMRATTLSPLKYFIKDLVYRLTIASAIRRAKHVIAVSEFTKKDIEAQFKASRGKVTVTYEGVFNTPKTADEDNDKKVILRYNISRPYVLYVGNAYPHKNLEALVSEFSGIREKVPGLKLVLVGKEDYFYLRVKQEALKSDPNRDFILFPGYVNDEDLVSFYREAEAYVFPSLYEGFGLPPLEAMAHGCPVVSSDKASMPEILGDGALYFDSNSRKGMRLAVIRITEDKPLRARLIKNGYERIKKYSWDDCAQRTLNIYKEFLEKKRTA